jgi:hypothetical protein
VRGRLRHAPGVAGWTQRAPLAGAIGSLR